MELQLTKRTLLQSAGAFAGGGAVYRIMDALGMLGTGAAHAAEPELPQDAGAGKRVLVLGAGIAGLTATYQLSKSGFECVVLEATGRPGGRSLTVRAGDSVTELDSRQTVDFDSGENMYANMGPARIPHHHRTVLGYCKRFGVPLEMFANDNRAALFHNKDRFGGSPMVARRVRTDVRGYLSELLAKAVNRNALDDALSGDEKERVLGLLRSYGSLDPDDLLYKGSARAGYAGATVNQGMEKGPINDKLDFSELLRSEFWEYKINFAEGLNQGPTMLQPVGGMDRIVEVFMRRVGQLVRYESEVREIRHAGTGGARVVFLDRASGKEEALEADFVVCTVPASVLRGISNDFSTETKAAIDSIQYNPSMKIGFQARRRFWEDEHAIYGGISWTDQDITQIWYPAGGFHEPKGILMGAYIWDDDAYARYEAMSPARRLESAAEEGGRLHQGYGSELESGVSVAWSKVPYQLGAWATSSTTAPAELRKPDGAVYFTGEHMTDLPGWQEGSMLSAHAAVSAIGERALAN